MHTNNENKDILILGKRQTKGLHNTTLTAEVEYYFNFSRSQRKKVFIIMEATAFCLLMRQKYISLNQKILK